MLILNRRPHPVTLLAMKSSVAIILIALAVAYGLVLIMVAIRRITKDRFYETRDERRRKREFKTAGKFVPKTPRNRPTPSDADPPG